MNENQTQRIYQTIALSPDIIDKTIVDDSPLILFDEFWPFMGVDIPLANIKELDFKIIRLMARQIALDILERVGEEDWDKAQIIEYELVKTKNGVEKKIKNIHRVVELLNKIDTKVYLKLCRAREGFTLNALTVQRSQIQQNIENRSIPIPTKPEGETTTQKKKSGWGL